MIDANDEDNEVVVPAKELPEVEEETVIKDEEDDDDDDDDFDDNDDGDDIDEDELDEDSPAS